MSTGVILLLYAAILALLIIVCALAIHWKQNSSSEKFDERQKIARGNAYCFSWWVAIAYYFALMTYFVFHTGKSDWVIQPFLLIFIGFLLQLQSFHIYCLMTHSALPLGEKPVPTIIGYFVLGGLHLLQYFLQYIPENVGYAGAASTNLLRLLISADFFSLAILHLIAYLRDRKE